jgi:hypothetical protein
LSDTLRAGEPVGPEALYLYYRKVCQFLDTEEGENTVSGLITMDQLDMLLCTLPSEETFRWGRWGDKTLEDLPDMFYDFCWQRAAELKAQIKSLEGIVEEPRVMALSSGYPRWLGPCILGEICGSYHMPEVCQMFEAMTPEGRLSVIQKKRLCQFCLRHPDTQPCPSHSLPACPIRGCMRMHHKMLHRALLREEARPVVLGMVQGAGGRNPEDNPLTNDSEDSALVTSDEEDGGEPEKSRLCMQMVPVEANNIVQGLHTLYDWGSTVGRESMKRLGFRPAQVAQRIVNGFGGATVPDTGCHFLPLIDVRGNHQVICAFKVEEITTVAETRLPPWAKEVFPWVRAHMPWMDTPAGPIELLIGLDNSQWLPVCLEDSKEPMVNMRLMKSSFGHQFMVMGGWGTALYPRDESMRYRGDPSGSRLTHGEMTQKVRLERCFRGRSQPGSKSRGRAPIKGPSPVREGAAPDYGPVGSRRPPPHGGIAPPPPRRMMPPPIRMPFNPPPPPPPRSQGGQGRGGQGRSGAVGPQQPQGPPFLNPMGMPGLLQPPGPVDPIQRLALMMAIMVLGMPQVYSCNIAASCGVLLGAGTTEPRICPSVESRGEIGISAMKEELDTRQWRRLPAIHCMAMQSSLSFMCGLDGRMRKVKYEKFRQPCGVQPAACWKALKSGRLKVGEMKYPTTMNQTRSHMTGEEGCSGSCRPQTRALERKIVQVCMEVLVEKDWIWWNAEKNQVATKSGKATTVFREGEAILEDGLRVWKPGNDGPILARVEGANLPIDGGGTSSKN